MFKKDLLYILDHYGEEAQLDKLQEEVNEFVEAIREGNHEHMIEEFADVKVMMNQFMYKYFTNDTDAVIQMMDYKVKRTIKRIEEQKKHE